MSDPGFAHEYWADMVFNRAVFDAGMDSPEAYLFRFLTVISEVFRDPANWRHVRIRRTPRAKEQAQRVTRALKGAKPGVLVRL